MHETELWITKVFNDYLAGAGNAVLSLAGLHAEHPDRPWANYITMQILVAIIVVLIFAILRPRLSTDKPGTLQHIFEAIYNFLHDQANDQVGHDAHRYLAFFGVLFIFILFANL